MLRGKDKIKSKFIDAWNQKGYTIFWRKKIEEKLHALWQGLWPNIIVCNFDTSQQG